MSANNNGGPAFPTKERKSAAGYGYDHHYHGMTLRDYFAAQVIASCIQKMPTLDKAAALAYQIADAMLKAREVGK